MSKIGRNDPCYCGSGKKYKQCHLKIDQQAEKERRDYALAGSFLRRDLLKFARDDQFAEDFAKALPFYWNGLYDIENAETMSQPEALRFFDWFVFDYQPETGPRLIVQYHAAEREALSTVQQTVLDGWLDVGPCAPYTLTGYDGQMLHVQDFVTGAEADVYEAGGHGNVEIGDVILTRLVPVRDQLELSTTAAYLPAAEVADLREKLDAARAADAAAHPDAGYTDFMRRHSHLLVHHALEQAKRNGRPPVARLDPDRDDKKTQKLVRQIARLKK